MIYNSRDYARLRNRMLLFSFAAWVVILLWPGAAPCCQYCGSAARLIASTPYGALAGDWLLMLIAMMTPMLISPIYHIRINSLSRRRTRHTALFLAGYASMWMAAGTFLIFSEWTAKRLMPGSYWPAFLIAVVAVIWQVSPFKQRCLNRCHSHPALAAFGPAADWSAARIGLEHGIWCVASCWAMMLLPMLLPQGHLIAMAAVGILMYCERLDPPGKPSWRLRGLGTALRFLKFRLCGPMATPAPFL